MSRVRSFTLRNLGALRLEIARHIERDVAVLLQKLDLSTAEERERVDTVTFALCEELARRAIRGKVLDHYDLVRLVGGIYETHGLVGLSYDIDPLVRATVSTIERALDADPPLPARKARPRARERVRSSDAGALGNVSRNAHESELFERALLARPDLDQIAARGALYCTAGYRGREFGELATEMTGHLRALASAVAEGRSVTAEHESAYLAESEARALSMLDDLEVAVHDLREALEGSGP